MKVAIYAAPKDEIVDETVLVFEGEVKAVFSKYECSISKASDTLVITIFDNIAIKNRPSYEGAIDIRKVV